VLRTHRIVSAQAGVREGFRTGVVNPLGKASSMSAVDQTRRFDIRVMSPFPDSGLNADVAALRFRAKSTTQRAFGGLAAPTQQRLASRKLLQSGARFAYQGNVPMKNFLLLLAILCAGASFAFYTADGATGDVPNWASNVCSAARTLCHSPQQMAIAAAGLAALWILVTFLSAVRY
jgi:hypothetical protein